MNIHTPTPSELQALRRLVQSTTAPAATPAPAPVPAQKAAPQLPASPAGDMAALRRLVAGNAAPAPEARAPVAEAKAPIIVAPVSDTAALRRLIAGQAPTKGKASVAQMSSAKDKSRAKEEPKKQAAEAQTPTLAPEPVAEPAAPQAAAPEMAPEMTTVSDIAALRRLIHSQAPAKEKSVKKENARTKEEPRKQATPASAPEVAPEIALEAAPEAAAEPALEVQAEPAAAPQHTPSDVAALRQLIHPDAAARKAQKQKKSAAAKKDSGKAPQSHGKSTHEDSKRDIKPAAEVLAQPVAAAPEPVEAPVYAAEPEVVPVPEATPLSDMAALRRLIPVHHDEPEAAPETMEMPASTELPPVEITQQHASMAHTAAGASAMTDLRRLLPAELSASEEAFAGAETLRGDVTAEILFNSGNNTGSLALEAGMGRDMFFGTMPQFNMETMNRFMRSLIVCVPAVMLSLALMENPFTLPQPALMAMIVLSLAALNIAVLAALDSYRHRLGDLTIPALLGFIAMVMLYVFATVCDRVAGTRGYDWLTPVTMIALIVCYGGIFRERTVPLKLFLGFNGLSLTVLWCLGAADKMSLPF